MIKRPAVNAAFIVTLSAFYSMLFIFIAEHMEFQSLLRPKGTLQAPLLNMFTLFLMNGHLKYVGYVFLAVAAVIVVFSVLRRRQYDEYQGMILARCAFTVGILTVLFVPLLLLLHLSDPTYSLEFMFLFIIIHWTGVLITDLILVVKFLR